MGRDNPVKELHPVQAGSGIRQRCCPSGAHQPELGLNVTYVAQRRAQKTALLLQ